MVEFMAYLRAAFANAARRQVRLGQALSDVLRDYRADLANEIIGTDLDPFYDDTRVGAFLTRVATEMSKPES